MRIIGSTKGAMSRLWIFAYLMSYVGSVTSQRVNTAPAEKEALLAFKAALRDQDRLLEDWKQSTDPCFDKWYGVYCVPTDGPANVDTNFEHVTELRLLKLNLGGNLVPELGNLTAIKYLDLYGCLLEGTIPPELGKLTNLYSLTLSGNKISGVMPKELGNLINLNRLQLDENEISGELPSRFSNLVKLQHMHLNNNSLEGSIPKEIGQLPIVVHILLDNNNMTGKLPAEIANISVLRILQLDNNKFTGGIPSDYGNLTKLTKLSCRDCGLSGPIPDLSRLTELAVLDLSLNTFEGNIPSLMTGNMTSINLSRNQLVGEIPQSLQSAKRLQYLTLANNQLGGPIPEFTNVDYSNVSLLDFQNNHFDYISLPMLANAVSKPNFFLWLSGNAGICQGSVAIFELRSLCEPAYSDPFSQSGTGDEPPGGPLVVTYRLKSPSFQIFTTYIQQLFLDYIAVGLSIDTKQVHILSWEWQPGPRLGMVILIYPSQGKFNQSEIDRIGNVLAHWEVKNSTFYGPYELLGFSQIQIGGGLSVAEKAGIGVASAAVVAFIILGILLLKMLRNRWRMSPAEKRRQRLLSKTPAQSMLKIKGVQAYTYKEMEKATDGFSDSNQVGRGGYGKVYRGKLEDGTIVAIKKAEEAALQRNTEFNNEIELLSRCHHRNLVSLIGYCNDESEQMLVYEFMEGGTLHDNLNAAASTPIDFDLRLRIALGSARGILYLHTEADPPIYHRDIKATNILLNDKKEAKVADFGLSRLAPVPDLEGVVMTHVSTVVKGTPGYLDPEYFLTHQLTDKSDVYSFGVVLLELLTGMQPISGGKNIVREVKQAYENGELLKVIDTRLGSYPLEIVESFAKLAVSCVANEQEARPRMQEVCRVLEELNSKVPGQGVWSTSSTWSIDNAKDFTRSAEYPFESGSVLSSSHGQFFQSAASRYYRVTSR
ncbi:hypothetical protein MPTK1_8g00010 [Marchantia polymorpha subsp. ruderalis]|uniref:non-specific serine/threonine protein kinase n=1 Tax=Marchantia polymorpha TaxID=3197 RepID=A0A2R6WLP2_MARPO|nr:hypothetical protein MARPO_0077s0067 [Marchantia polymorpha]BBN18130.1 hypothetical protein Mp_8g00010 [Marchantia polymorpha subsp. ruderalis]|eukprot:PTQ34752.1 hypothetical protein MARPO_0077s0067 [Marchantia polymorpha]